MRYLCLIFAYIPASIALLQMPFIHQNAAMRIPFAVALLCLPLLAAPSAAAQDRPNIVWISAEDVGLRFGAYGDAVANTPNLDRLASEGTRYMQAFTTAGVCAPSRAAIITGMHQNGWGGHHMRTTHDAPGIPTPYHATPPPYVKAFTEYLRAAGYFTTNDFKTDYQIGTPVTIWDEHKRGAHWRSPLREEGQPFFSVFNFGVTHESRSWVTPDEETTTDPNTLELPPYYPDTPEVRRQLAKHYDNIARLDEQAGEILSQLEEDGLADNTVVFFWGDHGDGLPRAKRWLYDSGIGVPLIVRAPGQQGAGSASERLVSLVDLGPTVLSLAGVPIPAHMDGMPFLGDAEAPPREYIYAARDRIDMVYDMVRAARDDRYKYIRNYHPEKPYVQFVRYRNRSSIIQEIFRLNIAGELDEVQQLWLRDSRPPEELYDVQADPHEINNLADDPALRDVLDRMRSELDAWMLDIDEKGHLSEDQMVRQMWMGEEQPVTATPLILRRNDIDREVEAEQDGLVEIVIEVGTDGASITYTTDEGEAPHWKLYARPIRLESGTTTTIRAKAIRYGYAESAETMATITVQP